MAQFLRMFPGGRRILWPEVHESADMTTLEERNIGLEQLTANFVPAAWGTDEVFVDIMLDDQWCNDCCAASPTWLLQWTVFTGQGMETAMTYVESIEGGWSAGDRGAGLGVRIFASCA